MKYVYLKILEGQSGDVAENATPLWQMTDTTKK
jgi:hypothetical protein